MSDGIQPPRPARPPVDLRRHDAPPLSRTFPFWLCLILAVPVIFLAGMIVSMFWQRPKERPAAGQVAERVVQPDAVVAPGVDRIAAPKPADIFQTMADRHAARLHAINLAAGANPLKRQADTDVFRAELAKMIDTKIEWPTTVRQIFADGTFITPLNRPGVTGYIDDRPGRKLITSHATYIQAPDVFPGAVAATKVGDPVTIRGRVTKADVEDGTVYFWIDDFTVRFP